MGKLTDWLDGLKITPVPRHPKFPALVQPPNFAERPPAPCVVCPQQGKPGHEEYGCGKLTARLPEAMLPAPDNDAFKAIQFLLHRLSADLFPPYGSGSFQHYGLRSVNFATTLVFNVSAVDPLNPRKVTITADGGDLRAVPIFIVMKGNWGAPGRSIIPILGSIQPNAIGKPGGGCIIDGKVSARLERVNIIDAQTAELWFDQDMSGVMIDNRYDQTEPYQPHLSLIGQWGDPEQWTRIVPPSVFKGQKRILSVTPAELPEHKRLNLLRNDGTEGRVAVPEPEEEGGRPATMRLWKKLKPVIDPENPEAEPEETDWEEITGEVYARLKMVSTGPGWNFRGAYRTLLCLGTLDHEGNEAFTDLITPEVERIMVEYYCEVPDAYTGRDWCATGGDRCVHCIKDDTDSYYGMTDGEAHITAGIPLANGKVTKEEEWFCELRRTWEIVETNDGKWKIEWKKPAKSEMFTASCSLYGVCPSYSPIHRGGEGARPFTLHRTANQVLKEATIGHNIGLVQVWPGWPLYYVKRMGRPTIHGLTTAVPTSNPTDWSPNVTYVQDGPSLVGNFDTAPPPDEEDEWGWPIEGLGNVFDPLIGGAWDGRVSWSELTFGDIPPPGIFPTNIAGWTNRIDALRRPLTDLNDRWRSGRYYEEDMSARANRSPNAVATFGRGVSQAVRTVGGDESFLLPELDVNDGTSGQKQEFASGVTFTWWETAQTDGPPGMEQYHVLIEFKPLIATGKTPRGHVKSAVIATALPSQTDPREFIFELENQPETWSRLRNEGFGNSWNETFTFNTGGKIFRPPDFLQIMSSATRDSSYGGDEDWVSIGDAAWIEHGDENFKKHRFTVTGGGAYQGTPAEDFGASTVYVHFNLEGGFYQVPEEVLTDASGVTGTPTLGTATTSTAVTDEGEEIIFTTKPPFQPFQVVRVEETGEFMQVVGLDANNNKVWCMRGVSPSHPAQPIPAESTITQVFAFNWQTRTAWEPTGSTTGEEKPGTIDAKKYWYDPDTFRYYFSPDDAGEQVMLAYYISHGENDVPTPDRSVYESYHLIFQTMVDGTQYNFPVFDTLRDFDDMSFGETGNTKIFIGDTEIKVLTQAELDAQANDPTDPKPLQPNQMLVTEDYNGHAVLQAHRTRSGADGRMEVDPGGDFQFNLDIAMVPEFATGIGWGKNKAIAILRDEPGGWLQAAVVTTELIGKTINFVRHEQVLSPDSEPVIDYTKWQEDSYATINESWYRTDCGRGRIYGNASMLGALRAVEGRKLCGWIH